MRVLSLLFAAFVAFALAPRAFAQTTYEMSKHGDADTGVMRLPEESPGSCRQCHEGHATRNGLPNPGPFNYTLFKADDETLCYECHSVAGSMNVYPGNLIWADSTHSMSSFAYWPGPVPQARPPSDAGKCVNCHDAHAKDDAGGIIPSMLAVREEALCLGCHKGTPAKDVNAQFAKTYKHPIAFSARHSAAEANTNDPIRYASAQRHVECADCHNPHVARPDGWTPVPPEATRRLEGVSRIEVLNNSAGTTPTYVWRDATDTLAPNEFEICFKCHSSWTTLPAGKSDLSRLTNPNNPSFHPIQAAGKNRNIDPFAFTTGWTWDRLVYCADCHGSDDPLVRGPHGSTYPYILRARSSTSAIDPPQQTDLCFSCHRFEVYGDNNATDATQQASRFNRPRVGKGHAFHVGTRRVPCYACHTTHGSETHPALIAAGRNPGITLYSQNAAGGTCTPTCHQQRSYTVNYAR